MHVSEILDLIAQFAFPNTPTNKQRKEFLRCLNLANCDLYQIILNANSFLQKLELFVDNNGECLYPQNTFYVKRIYAGINLLQSFDLRREELKLKDNEYFIFGNTIQVGTKDLPKKVDINDGISKPYITLLVIPTLKRLVELVNDPLLEVDTPLFPEPHHQSLIHGALYYLFLSGRGYIEKTKYQLIAYEESKKNLATYYEIK